jgi:hypothetical protein
MGTWSYSSATTTIPQLHFFFSLTHSLSHTYTHTRAVRKNRAPGEVREHGAAGPGPVRPSPIVYQCCWTRTKYRTSLSCVAPRTNSGRAGHPNQQTIVSLYRNSSVRKYMNIGAGPLSSLIRVQLRSHGPEFPVTLAACPVSSYYLDTRNRAYFNSPPI